jgi:EF-P beta-lysylation protein EpmB
MTTHWQKSLSNLITDPKELCQLLALDLHTLVNEHAITEFSLRVPRSFVARMEKGNPQDPLLKQILPIAQEMQLTPGYSHDPLGESDANPAPGLLHKYHGRLLLLVTGGCAINCRYCFRRHFPYHDNAPGTQGWDKVITYIEKDPTISEVIYSGGDPLLAKDDMLAALTQKIAAIDHVHTLRIHTRLPIVIPERITTSLLTWLTETRLKTVLVTHANHPNEIDYSVKEALQRLRNAGVTVLNQSVLLQGVNDDVDTLVDLSRKLFDASVLPYYLHMLDAVQGAAHFAVSDEKAKKLIAEMCLKLPGYLVPKLVREKSGVLTKMPLGISNLITQPPSPP